MLSPHQQMVIDRLVNGDELRCSVTWGSSGCRLGIGEHRFTSDRKCITIATIQVLMDDYGLVRRTNYGSYDKIELLDDNEQLRARRKKLTLDTVRFSLNQRLTVKQAKAQGFKVDDTCYPWYAYKGPRFEPTEWKYVLTSIEAVLAGRDEDVGQDGVGLGVAAKASRA